jgi:Protein of unknown function (DUF3892)
MSRGTMANIYITAIRLSIPNGSHEHISRVWYSETSKQYQQGHQNKTVQEAIDFLGNSFNSAKVYNPRTGGTVDVNVVRTHSGSYLRTSPDNTTADNLLSLPRK